MNNTTPKVILLIVAWILTMPLVLFADLPRPLKNHEVRTLEENIKKNPINLKSRNFLADHFSIRKDWRNVVRVLAPATASLKESQLKLLATAYIELDDTLGATALSKHILNQKKMDIAKILLLVKIYNLQARNAPSEDRKTEKVKVSINMLKEAQQSHPENKQVYDLWLETLEAFVPHYQFDALVIMEKMKKAKISYKPKHYSLICRYNHLAGYIKQTLSTCKEATQVDERNPLNWIYLGKAHIAAGEQTRGQRMLASVGKKYSHSEEALWATANMYRESKDLISAYDFYRKASLHKDSKPRDFLGLALVAFELKKYGEALTAFRKHCSTSKVLDHEFRRASGLLKDKIHWQKKYRAAMQGCNK